MAKSRPGKIHERIVNVMKRFPQGVTGGQIRQELEKEGLRAEDQTHLDRRKRDLKKWFIIRTETSTQVVDGRARKVAVYKFGGDKPNITDEGDVSTRIRAEVLHAVHGQCQMCGKTIAQHSITLVVDHKKPRAWGGTNDVSNLWAVCVACNAGKKALFSSVHLDAKVMKKIMASDSVHVRIGELLKVIGVGKPVPSYLLQIVADQDDWHKRLRELRYPVIGWEIETRRYRSPSGKVKVDYILKDFRPWPDDPSGVVRRFEQERERRNRGEAE